MIIVTGGAGMIGSNVVRALNQQGRSDIIVVDDLTDGTKFANLTDSDIADYCDKDDFLRLVEAGSAPHAEVIFHQGACSATTEWNGKLMMEQNYAYSKALFHHCQAVRIPLIYASSAAVYGNSSEFSATPANERPLNVYGWSKKLFDDFVRGHLPQATAPVVGLRYFNVYGPREGHKGSMASVAFHLYHQLMRGENPKLFGGYDGVAAGQQSRDFIHVEDVAAVNLWAWSSGVSGVFNCGTGRAEPFLTVADTMIGALGRGAVEFIDFPDHLKGRYQSYTCADMTGLRNAGYGGQFRTVATGVAQYAAWLQQHG